MSSLVVNGNEQPHLEGESLRDLLIRVALDPEQRGIAIAVNDEVVPRSDWPVHVLSAGDTVELIHAVQGG